MLSYFADLRSNRNRRKMFPFATWAKLFRETISNRDEDLLKTVPFNGIYELRLAIANYLHDHRGMQVYPSQIIICSGIENLYSRLIPLLTPDAIWGSEQHGSKKIQGLFQLYHAQYRPIETDEDGICIDSLVEQQCNIVHVSPSNMFPTSSIMPVKRRQELLQWAAIDDHYIVEDDYDTEFRYQGKPIPTLYSMDTMGKVIYMNTFSKTMIPSLRISYMVLPFPLVEQFKDGLSFFSGTVPSLEQYVLARFISEGYFARHVNHMKNFYKAQRTRLFGALHASRLNAVSTIIESNSGTHFLLKVKTRYSDSELAARANLHDIDVAMLTEYMDRPEFQSTLVINYAGLHEERIDETVSRLCHVILD